MKKSAAQLGHEIADGLEPSTIVSVKKLFAWRPKVEATIVDINEGRRSHNTGKPLVVSKLDSPRGAYFIIDGHHRAVEAILAGRPTVDVVIDPYVPRIERTGGGFKDKLDAKVNVREFVGPSGR